MAKLEDTPTGKRIFAAADKVMKLMQCNELSEKQLERAERIMARLVKLAESLVEPDNKSTT